jgi:hypothetical protein
VWNGEERDCYLYIYRERGQFYFFKRIFIYYLSEKEEKKTVGLRSGSCLFCWRSFQWAVCCC